MRGLCSAELEAMTAIIVAQAARRSLTVLAGPCGPRYMLQQRNARLYRGPFCHTDQVQDKIMDIEKLFRHGIVVWVPQVVVSRHLRIIDPGENAMHTPKHSHT
jgi:hypothetical protein